MNGVDITAATETQMQAFRGETVSMIFQDPMTSLNPVIKVGKQIEEVLLVHRPNMSKQEREKRVDEMLEMIGISPERKKRISSSVFWRNETENSDCHCACMRTHATAG